MKKCFKCGKEKPISEFYVHKAMADGYMGKCKDCTRKDVSRNYMKNHEHYIEYDRSRIDNPKRVEYRVKYSRWLRENHPEIVKRYHDKYSKTKRSASTALNNAVRDHRIIKGNCEVCNNIKSEGHHEDYGSPLDVIWLCKRHHGYVHRFSGDERKNIIKAIKNHIFYEKRAS